MMEVQQMEMAEVQPVQLKQDILAQVEVVQLQVHDQKLEAMD